MNPVTENDFDNEVLQSDQPVLVDFWAEWCGPCHAVAPVLDTIVAERPDELKLVKVNIDEAPRVAQRFEVQAIPTLVLIHRGQVLDRQIGAAPESTLRAWLDRALADGLHPT